jgi:hypothetical protein
VVAGFGAGAVATVAGKRRNCALFTEPLFDSFDGDDRREEVELLVCLDGQGAAGNDEDMAGCCGSSLR